MDILKKSHPVEVAEYATAREIADKPAFSWWVPFTLGKRYAILSAITSFINRTRHKHGIEIPKGIKNAHEIYAKEGITLWRKAIDKEMYNVGVAFEILDHGARDPPGWNRVSGHLILDVKMDFTQKARWVLNGHLMPDPEGSTYAGVVSRESIIILLRYAELKGLDICAAEI